MNPSTLLRTGLGAKREIAANDVFVLRAFASLKEGKPWVKPKAKYKEIRVKPRAKYKETRVEAWAEYFETAGALRYINISAKGVEVVYLTLIWYKYFAEAITKNM